MGENKEIKVRLSTVVYLFIILVLVGALGVVYYLGFVKDDNANNMIANGEVAEKNNISVNEQVPQVNNNVEEKEEEKVEQNKIEQSLKEYKGKDAISLLAKEDTRFVINEIKNNGDTYIISASILEKEPRKISEEEYKDIIEGQEVTFRDIKWKYDKSINDDEYATYLKATQDYNNMQATDVIALRSGNTEGVRYFTNIAGVAGNLSDYSDVKVEFEVSKDIKVCSFFGEFEYVNGKLVCRNIDNEDMETTAQTIDTLIEFRNNNEPGTGGTYEECIAYVSNGNVDAIKIFEK